MWKKEGKLMSAYEIMSIMTLFLHIVVDLLIALYSTKK